MSKSKIPKKNVSTGKTKRTVSVKKDGEQRAGKGGGTTKKRVRPTVSRVKSGGGSPSVKDNMLFKSQNYILMAAGAGIIALGMVLMIGGHMPDPNTWDSNVIYSFRITVLAPVMILSGLALEIYAIFKK